MKRLFVIGVAAAAVLPFVYSTASGGSAARKTTICHRTSSAKNPYVKLTVSASALKKYTRLAADIIPAPRGGCPKTVLSATAGGTAFSVTLTGEAENPAGDPVSTGTATFRLRAGQGQVCFTLHADNLPSAAAASHIHTGAAGTVGAVVVPLKTPDANGAASGCVVAARTVVASILKSPAAFYANVHTAEFPGGAIRGQLQGSSAAAIGKVFALPLSGANERPTTGDPDGSGTAVIRIRRDAALVCYRFSVKNVVLPATGAHIHRGSSSIAGPVVVPFTPPGASGASGGCNPAETTLIDEILANPANFYANVHSTEFPGGAIRAQLP